MIFGFGLFDKDNVRYITEGRAETRAFQIVDKYLGQGLVNGEDLSVSDVAFLNSKKKKEVDALSESKYEELKDATINKMHKLGEIYNIKDIDSYKASLENAEKDNVVRNYKKKGINNIEDVVSDIMKNEKIFTASGLIEKLNTLIK